MIKLLIPRERSGVQYWRTWLPVWELEKKGLVEIKTFDVRSFSSKEVSEGLKWCDIVIGRGFSGTAGLSLLRNYQSLGKPVVVDYDDFTFDVDPLIPAYKWHGTEEVEIETDAGKSWLWKDGVDGFNLKQNRINAGARLSIIQEAAAVTTTTPYLKEQFKKLTGRSDIFVVPNGVNKANWKPMPDAREKYKDGFRFGWFVSNAHSHDMLYIRNTLKEFLLEHKDAKLVLMGDCSGVNLEDFFPTDQIEWYPFCDLYEDHYPIIAASLALDVGIAPLEHTEFNKCKSPLKFAEYTYFGYPTILERLETYEPYVTDGESALLAGNPQEWKQALERVYRDKGLRSKLRFNALYVCDAFFDVSKVCMDWYSVFKAVLNREVILK